MTKARDWARQKALLEARRLELTGRLTKIETELDQLGSPDDDDRAAEREPDEVLSDLGVAGQRELAAIEAALARIREGKYGICASCGAEISPARLKAVPTTAVCRECAGIGADRAPGSHPAA